MPLNCRSLNNIIKIKLISKILTKEHSDILFLQGTNLNTPVKEIFKTYQFPQQCQVSRISKSRAVAILISKNVPCYSTRIKCDPRGRLLFVKGKLDGINMTLGSLYAPDSNQIEFIFDTLKLGKI